MSTVSPALSSLVTRAQLRTAAMVLAQLLYGPKAPHLPFYLSRAAHGFFDAEILAQGRVPWLLSTLLQEFRYREGDPSQAAWFGPIEAAVEAWAEADEAGAARPDPLDAEGARCVAAIACLRAIAPRAPRAAAEDRAQSVDCACDVEVEVDEPVTDAAELSRFAAGLADALLSAVDRRQAAHLRAGFRASDSANPGAGSEWALAYAHQLHAVSASMELPDEALAAFHRGTAALVLGGLAGGLAAVAWAPGDAEHRERCEQGARVMAFCRAEAIAIFAELGHDPTPLGTADLVRAGTSLVVARPRPPAARAGSIAVGILVILAAFALATLRFSLQH